MAFLVDLQIGVTDHVQQHAPAVAMRRRIVGVCTGEVLRSPKVLVSLTENELLAVEKHEVHAVLARQVGHLVAQLHQYRYAAGAVVGPHKRSPRVATVEHRKRQGVVMGAKQDPLLALGVPLDDQVGHGQPGAVHGMAGPEPLKLHLSAKLLKMRSQQLLLGLHAGRSAGAPPDGTDLPQVLVRPGPVKRDVFQPQLGRRGLGAAVVPPIAKDRQVAEHRAAGHDNHRQKHRLARESASRFALVSLHGLRLVQEQVPVFCVC